MKIASGMFDNYLGNITVGWFSKHDVSADHVSEYDQYIHEVATEADQHNDLLPLRLAMDWILLNPDKYSLEDHGGVYLFEHGEVTEILRYMRQKIYPEAGPPNPEEVKDVEIFPQSRFDWWDQRERDGLLDRSRIVTNGPAQWVIDYNKAIAEGRQPLLPGETA